MTEKDICEKLKEIGTSSVSDALDKQGIPGGLKNIRRVSSDRTICGRAFTVRYIPCGTVKHTVGDFLDDVRSGQVIVIANNGRTDCTVWGDIMSRYSSLHGIEGTVIDGVCRDLDSIQKIGYPVYSRGQYMMTGKDRVECEAVNVPVNIAGRMVKPGDYILADASGAIVIPEEIAEEVLLAAIHIEQVEQEIVREIMAGSSLRDARAKNGYHSLQTCTNV